MGWVCTFGYPEDRLKAQRPGALNARLQRLQKGIFSLSLSRFTSLVICTSGRSVDVGYACGQSMLMGRPYQKENKLNFVA